MCYKWRHLMSIFYIYFHRVAAIWSFFDRIARCKGCAAFPCLPPVDNSAVRDTRRRSRAVLAA